MAKEKILVVEDEKNIAKLIKFNLEKDGYETISTKSGEEAIQILGRHEVDLILLDIMLPGMNGLEVCKEIKQMKRTKNVPVIMLTAKSEEVDRIVGFEIGADDYITKPFSPRELILRVKAILRRGKTEDSARKEILSEGDINVDISRHEVTVKGKLVELTQMEFKLLCVFLERRGRVQTRDSLLTDVWGMDTMVETRTIDTHIKSLRSKLGKAGEKIETVRGMGYKFSDTD